MNKKLYHASSKPEKIVTVVSDETYLKIKNIIGGWNRYIQSKT